MPQFFLLKKIDAFLNEFVADDKQSAFFRQTILGLSASDVKLTQKQFNNRTIHSLNANYGRYYHRLIFEKVQIDREDTYILRAIAWAHDYDKATRWDAIGSMTKTQFDQAYPNACRIDSISIKRDVDMQVATTHVVEFKNKPLTLTNEQSDRLAHRHYPELNIGPPGSGKTLLALESLKDKALGHQQDGQGALTLLYLTHNEKLVESLKKEWASWSRSHLLEDDNSPRVSASFLTFEALAKRDVEIQNAHLSDKDTAKCFKMVGKDYIKTQLTNKLNTLKKDHGLSADMLYEELLLNAHYVKQDIKNNAPFNQSSYQSRGTQQSFIHNKTLKQKAYPILTGLIEQMTERYEHHVGVSSLPSVSATTPYDLVVVDEAQNASLSDIDNAWCLSKNHQLLLLGDSFQKGHIKISALSIIESHFQSHGRVGLNCQILPSTKRLTPENAKAINELVLLYSHLRGGKLDNVSYHSLPPADSNGPKQDDFITLMTAYDDKLKNLGSHATSGVIVLCKEDKDQAKALTNARYVFEVGEAQGLEFSEVFFYLSEKTANRLSALGQKMAEKGVKPGDVLKEHTHHPAQKSSSDDASFEILSNLIVGLSRSYGGNWLYIEHKNNIKSTRHQDYFISWFQSKLNHRCDDVQASLNNLIEKKSTPEQWLMRIDEFIREGAIDAAQNTLCSELNYTNESAKAYINSKQNPSQKNIIAQPKVQSQQKPSAAASSGPVQDAITPKPTEPSRPNTTKAIKTKSPEPQESQEQLAFKKLTEELKTTDYKRFKVVMSLITGGVLYSCFKWDNSYGHELISCIVSSEPSQKNMLLYATENTDVMTDAVWNKLIGTAQRNKAHDFVKKMQHLLAFTKKIKNRPVFLENSIAHVAAYDGNLDMIQLLIDIGVDFNNADNNGFTPAYVAAREGHANVIAELAKHGVDLNKAALGDITPAHIAARHGHANVIAELAKLQGKQAVDFNKAMNDGVTPVFIAAAKGHTNIITELAKLQGEQAVDFNKAAVDGSTPAFVAAYEGRANVIAELAKLQGKQAVDFNKARNDGTTPVFIAAAKGHTNIITELAKLQGEQAVDFNKTSKYGSTLACIAAEKGHLKVIKMLIQLKVDLKVAFKISEEALTEKAKEFSSEQKDRLNAFVQTCERDENNLYLLTPIDIAKIMGHTEIVTALEQAIEKNRHEKLYYTENKSRFFADKVRDESSKSVESMSQTNKNPL